MYIREPQISLQIRLLKKVLFLMVLIANLFLISFATNTHAALPRAMYGKCYYTEQSLIDGTINHWNSTNQAISIVRHISAGTYNSTTDVLTLTAENTNTGSVTSTTTYVTEPCNAQNKSLFDNLPTQDVVYQVAFVFAFLTGIGFGFNWGKF